MNLMLPEILDLLILPQVEGGQVVFTTGYFRKIQEIANPYGATAYVAGGVVRAICGYIYQELYDAYYDAYKESNNKQLKNNSWGKINSFTSPEDFLRPFLSEWLKAHPTLDPIDVLGIGSDCDILIDGCSIEDQIKLENEIKAFMNGAEENLGLRNQQSIFKKVIFPPADVKEYTNQIERTTQQGGSTSDWMAFPLKNVNGVRQIREPEGHDIFGPLLKGKLEYIAGNNVQQKQRIRGLRALTELPFGALTEEGKKNLITELNALPNQLNPEAQDQIAKATRNARFQGAGNRLSKEPWCKIPVVQNNFPAYVPYKDFTKRDIDNKEDNKDFIPLSIQDFIRQHTDNGNLYHGTKEKANLISMLRGGLVMSNDKAGTRAAYGDGFYTTNNLSIAQGYASREGIVLKFKVKDDKKIKILNLNDPEHLGFYETQEKSYKGTESFHNFLRDTFDIDIIVNEHVLILNEAVLEKDLLKDLIPPMKTILIKKLPFTVDEVTALVAKGLSEEEIEVIGKFANNKDYNRENLEYAISDLLELNTISDLLQLERNKIKNYASAAKIIMDKQLSFKVDDVMAFLEKGLNGEEIEVISKFANNTQGMWSWRYSISNLLELERDKIKNYASAAEIIMNKQLSLEVDDVMTLLEKGLNGGEIEVISKFNNNNHIWSHSISDLSQLKIDKIQQYVSAAEIIMNKQLSLKVDDVMTLLEKGLNGEEIGELSKINNIWVEMKNLLSLKEDGIKDGIKFCVPAAKMISGQNLRLTLGQVMTFLRSGLDEECIKFVDTLKEKDINKNLANILDKALNNLEKKEILRRFIHLKERIERDDNIVGEILENESILEEVFTGSKSLENINLLLPNKNIGDDFGACTRRDRKD